MRRGGPCAAATGLARASFKGRVQRAARWSTDVLLWAGFLLGCAFGVAARLGRFCLLRGLREAPALRAFALALAVALLASQALAWAGWADLGTAQVVRARFSLPGVLIGGLLFGVGMVTGGEIKKEWAAR